MQFNTQRIVRRYLLIPVLALLSGVGGVAWSHAELKDEPGNVLNDWPKAELHQAAQAALKYRAAEGHLPQTLADLQKAQFLPSDFNLPGTMYFRDSESRPRLSWHDDQDGTAAYCSLDAAIREHC
ncbi:hypothetical protein [Paraburkholderia youngii]|uniref:hypothetical protein n=1 Tax=Paraburkholderia youngii TaxID=2782701 RepID=UPI003D19D0DB